MAKALAAELLWAQPSVKVLELACRWPEELAEESAKQQVPRRWPRQLMYGWRRAPLAPPPPHATSKVPRRMRTPIIQRTITLPWSA